MDRHALLNAAEAATTARGEAYGDATANLTRIATLWSVILGIEVTASEVAAMMVALKLARLVHTPGHTDSWVDIAGYAALGAEVSEYDEATDC
jgi:hypothetical protein